MQVEQIFLIKTTEEFEYFVHNPDDPNSLSANNIRWVFEDLSGNVWFGTQNGLNKFNREERNFERFISGTNISTIYESQR